MNNTDEYKRLEPTQLQPHPSSYPLPTNNYLPLATPQSFGIINEPSKTCLTLKTDLFTYLQHPAKYRVFTFVSDH